MKSLRWTASLVGLVLLLVLFLSADLAPIKTSGPVVDSGVTAAPEGIRLRRPRIDPNRTWEPRSELLAPAATIVDLGDVPQLSGLAAPPVRKARRKPWMPISEAKAARLRAAALRMPPDLSIRDSGESLFGAKAGGYASVSAFADGIHAGENPGTLTPPDPELAVGINHLLAVVNVSFAIYDKSTGTRTSLTSFETFFSGVSGCSGVFDPNVLYDESADRFILGIDGNGGSYCVAASDDGDPNGTWFLYSFGTLSGSCGSFFDFPQAGVGDDAIYMGANMFAGNFCESRVWAMDKAAMYAGAPMLVVNHSTGVESTPQPANLHGWAQGTWPVGGPHYFVTDDQFDGVTFSQWSWNDPFGADIFVRDGAVAWAGGPQGFPIAAPTKGGRTITDGDWRVQDAEYRNGTITTVHNVSCNPGTGTVDCEQWTQYDPATLSVIQGGVHGANNRWRIYGDIAVNHCEDMLLGYTGTNANVRPAVLIAGRKGTMPAGLMTTDVVIKVGEKDYTSFDSQPYRWGDYSGATSDPNGQDLWYLGEYSKNTGVSSDWATYIGVLSLACPTP